MSRELKFRVWDFFKKRWVKSWIDHCSQSIAFLPEESDDGKHNVEFFDTFNGSEFVFQQYTGLKDLNEVEIYEGDIMAFANGKHPSPIIWDDGYYLWNDDILDSRLAMDLIVVGNIFETPELL